MKNPIGVCVDRNPFGDVVALLDTVARAGFDQVEWFEVNADAPWSAPETAPRLRELTRQRSLEVRYHAPYELTMDLSTGPAGLRTPQEIAAVIRECLARADRLGAKLMTLHLGTCANPADRGRALDRAVEGINLALPDMGRLGIRIALENHTNAIIKSALGDSPAEFARIMPALPAKWVGRTFDIGHAHINNHLEEYLSQPLDRILNVHLHDNHGTQDEHLPLGKGIIPWKDILGRLASAAYSGPLTLEFTAAPEDYLESLGFLRSL